MDSAFFDKSPPLSVLRPHHRITPLIVASPHSGTCYPEAFLRQSRLDLHTLRQCEDAYVDNLLADATDLGVPLLSAHFPRVYCDVNRAAWELDQGMFRERLPPGSITDSPKIRAGIGMIARVATAGRGIYRERLPLAEAETRIANCWQPYHTALQELLAEARERFGFAVLLDAHSMPRPQYRGLPDIVLGDAHGRSANADIMALLERAFKSLGYRVARNNPYAGGYVTQRYGDPSNGVHAVQIEIARSLYMDEATLTPHDGFARVRRDMYEALEMLTTALPKEPLLTEISETRPSSMLLVEKDTAIPQARIEGEIL